ncbi:hypothetical protein M9H77_18178 [Catharanthus roseus]|uniref:Uncharacterized protein n=1 Tax=Catharanthus roseus TaxID=4058 RepID=A0ACC0B6R6_CATRO|nr:hypothetical protein M9H77_18178 [Catharanthus roseus]
MKPSVFTDGIPTQRSLSSDNSHFQSKIGGKGAPKIDDKLVTELVVGNKGYRQVQEQRESRQRPHRRLPAHGENLWQHDEERILTECGASLRSHIGVESSRTLVHDSRLSEESDIDIETYLEELQNDKTEIEWDSDEASEEDADDDLDEDSNEDIDDDPNDSINEND